MMIDINNREIATLFWISILIIWALVFSKNRKEVRKSIMGIIRTFFAKQLIVIFFLLFSYIILEIYILWLLGFWELSLLKETTLWTLVALGVLMTVNDKGTSGDKLKLVILKALAFSVAVEYIINIFSFSLIVELAIYPIIAFFVVVQVIGSYKEEHKILLNLANKVLIMIVLFTIGYNCYHILSNSDTFNITLEFKKLVTPFLLTVFYMPFPYLFFIYLIHENIRVVVLHSSKDRGVVNSVTKQVLKKFKLNLFALEKWRKEVELYRIKSKEDIYVILD